VPGGKRRGRRNGNYWFFNNRDPPIRRPWGASWTELEGSAGLSADEAARIAWMSMHGVATLMLENRFNPAGGHFASTVSIERLRRLNPALSGRGCMASRSCNPSRPWLRS